MNREVAGGRRGDYFRLRARGFLLRTEHVRTQRNQARTRVDADLRKRTGAVHRAGNYELAAIDLQRCRIRHQRHVEPRGNARS